MKREAVAHLKAHLGLSERRACQIAGADRTMVRYQSQRAPDTALRGRLRDLANERRRFGCRRFFVLLRREGELTSNAILKGCAETKIEWHDIAPGKPMRDTVSSKASTAGCGTNF